jgi:hypothetical protein
MRPVTLGNPPADQAGKIDWIIRALQEIERASNDDPIKVFDSYSSNVAPTATRAVNTSSPTTANLAAVLGTLIADMRKRGMKRG